MKLSNSVLARTGVPRACAVIVTTASLVLAGGLAANAVGAPVAAGPASEHIASAVSVAAQAAASAPATISNATRIPGGAFEAATADSTVAVPATTAGEVTLGHPRGTALAIGLPNEVTAGAATRASNGTVTYTGGANSADVAVQVLSDGVRISTLVGSPSESSRFTYPIGDGVQPVVEANGSVSLTKLVSTIDPSTGAALSATAIVGSFAEPWARDARGVAVPTHYELNGSSVVQVVDHAGAGFAYPIVADPRITNGIFISTIWFSRAETATLSAGGWGATGIAALCTLAGGPIAGGACLLAAGSIVYTAGVAYHSVPKKCVAVQLNSLIIVTFPSVYVYTNQYCR